MQYVSIWGNVKTFVVSITYQIVRFSPETLILFIFCFVLFFSNEARIFVSLQKDSVIHKGHYCLYYYCGGINEKRIKVYVDASVLVYLGF